MSRARYLVGDVFDRMAELPDGSVDLVLTSPPFLALRSYLPADHPDKAKEIGSEPTPAEFLSTLLALTAEWRRVLAPHGSICVELGDTYSGSGGAGGDYGESGFRVGQHPYQGSAKTARTHKPEVGPPIRGFPTGKQGGGPGWPLPKSLCGIPHLYHLSLAYGRNLLTGEPCEPWRVRNVVAWCRPNPPVGALGDKFRPATSYMTIACVSGKRYFDLDAVRTEHKPNGGDTKGGTSALDGGKRMGHRFDHRVENPAGAPPLDWWEIPTSPYPGSHYATWPQALLVRPIESMAPRKVCTVCGEPSRRIVEASYVGCKTGEPYEIDKWESGGGENHAHANKRPDERATRQATTLGWSDCGHNAWRPGLVLDPFAGSGTTLAVATARGRDAIGIDLDARNLDLARERIGMWLEEEPTEAAS